MAGLPLASCADLLRAVHALGLSRSEDLKTVALTFGLQIGDRGPEMSDITGPPPPEWHGGHNPAISAAPPARSAPSNKVAPPEAHISNDLPIPSTITRHAPRAASTDDGIEAGDGEDPGAVEHLPPWVRLPALAPTPLLQPVRARAILGELAATLGASATPDIPHLVDAIARGRTIRHIPSLVRRTMALGTQVLLDSGPGMAPFRDDLAAIARDITAVAGESVEVLWCADHPSTVWAPHRPSHGYIAPPPGVPVIAVSDLGVRASLDSGIDDPFAPWHALAKLLRGRGSRLVALTPLDLERIPRWVIRQIAVVPLDRSTTVRQVRVQMANVVDT